MNAKMLTFQVVKFFIKVISLLHEPTTDLKYEYKFSVSFFVFHFIFYWEINLSSVTSIIIKNCVTRFIAFLPRLLSAYITYLIRQQIVTLTWPSS